MWIFQLYWEHHIYHSYISFSAYIYFIYFIHQHLNYQYCLAVGEMSLNVGELCFPLYKNKPT